ncbi:hypothetical protein AB0E23_33930, partial [Streptomyces chartreusis]
MRQALTRGLIAAAAATSALSLYGTGASAAPLVQGAVAKSAAALPGHSDPWDSDGLNEQLDEKIGNMHEKFGEAQDQFQEVQKKLDNLDLPRPTSSENTSGHGNSGYGTDAPSSHGYGSEKPTDHGYGSEKPK